MSRAHTLLAIGFLLLFGSALGAQDRVLPWRLEPIVAVGGATDSNLVLSTLHLKDVAATSGNRIALVDHSEYQVVILGPKGRIERRLGRRGAGPGEFSFPSSIAATPDGAIWVWDLQRNALVGFGPQGAPLSQRTDLPGTGLVQGFSFLSDGRLLVLRTRRDSINLWWVTDARPQILVSVVQPPSKSVPPGTCPITDYLARPVFTTGLLWATRNATIATNVDGAYAIRIHGGRYDGAVLHRAESQRRATADLAKRELGAGTSITFPGQGGGCMIAAADILATVGFAAHLPAYFGLLFTDDDTLWAVRYTLPGEPRLADVYSLAHGYLGTIALGHAVPVTVRTDGSLVSVELDDSDVPRVVVYQVRR
jgi:hypothetical protein